MAAYSKFFAALVGTIATGLVSAGVIDAGQSQTLVSSVMGLLTVAGVYAVPNKTQ